MSFCLKPSLKYAEAEPSLRFRWRLLEVVEIPLIRWLVIHTIRVQSEDSVTACPMPGDWNSVFDRCNYTDSRKILAYILILGLINTCEFLERKLDFLRHAGDVVLNVGHVLVTFLLHKISSASLIGRVGHPSFLTFIRHPQR